ncbi:MAG: hypothetical protein AAF196_19295 [Planctomycetota bacterium]
MTVQLVIGADGLPELSIDVDGELQQLSEAFYTRANANSADFVGLDDRGLLVEGTVSRNGNFAFMFARHAALGNTVAATGQRL